MNERPKVKLPFPRDELHGAKVRVDFVSNNIRVSGPAIIKIESTDSPELFYFDVVATRTSFEKTTTLTDYRTYELQQSRVDFFARAPKEEGVSFLYLDPEVKDYRPA